MVREFFDRNLPLVKTENVINIKYENAKKKAKHIRQKFANSILQFTESLYNTGVVIKYSCISFMNGWRHVPEPHMTRMLMQI